MKTKIQIEIKKEEKKKRKRRRKKEKENEGLLNHYNRYEFRKAADTAKAHGPNLAAHIEEVTRQYPYVRLVAHRYHLH